MTRIFETMKEAINEIERDIMEMGIQVHPHSMQNKMVSDDENFETLEVQNYSFAILKLTDKDEQVSDCLNWCKAEFEERIAPFDINPGDAWKLRPEVWKEFLTDLGTFDYTYNERIRKQLTEVIKELKENPDSRRACIDIHKPYDTINFMRALVRIPCSMYYQFLIRRGKLDIIYNMRSSDFDTHFKNDIWLAGELRDYIARQIDIEPGMFFMNIGSLHRYKNYTTKHVF